MLPLRPSPRPVGRALLILAGLAAPLLVAGPASADVSSWLFLGAGPSWLDRGADSSIHTGPTLQLETGLGTPPADWVVFGGMARLQTHFGATSDLGILLRTATHGYVNGDWGAAIDLGGYQRLTERSRGLLGALALGAPWGITLSASGGLGENDQRMVSAVLGIDFARLTVYRRTGDAWWRNPFPAYRPEEE